MELKAMPSNIQAEQGLLGTILSNPNSLGDIVGQIEPKDLYKDAHKILFNLMLDMFSKNIKIDIITVVNELKAIDGLDHAGGITYISELAGSTLGNNIQEYAKIIKEKSNKRNLIKIAQKVMEQGYESKINSKDLINQTEDELFKLTIEKENQVTEIQPILENVMNEIQELAVNGGGLTGIETGFREIDRITSGLQKSDFIILAARPSMGKTTLALNMASFVSNKNSVAIFSLEMSKEQLVKKVIAAEGHIDYVKINTGALQDDDWNRLGKATGVMANKKLFIDDTPGITVNEIKAKSKKIKMQYGLDIIVIDYLGLITGQGENRTQEISGISRGLKQLAKELNVPVIALCQLSRSPEQRADHRPMLSDLRESGSIEQDADIVLFLYRDEYYNKETEEKNIAECIFAKNRNGKVGTVKLAWLGQFQKFGNLDYIHQGTYNPDIFKK